MSHGAASCSLLIWFYPPINVRSYLGPGFLWIVWILTHNNEKKTVVNIGHFIALIGKSPDYLSFIPQYLSNFICRTKVSAPTFARHGKREWRVWMPLQKCSTIPEPFQLLTVHYAVFLIRTVIQMTPSDPSGLTVVLCTIICQPADCCCLPTVISYIRLLPYNKKMIICNKFADSSLQKRLKDQITLK